jgi:hypothetical protein
MERTLLLTRFSELIFAITFAALSVQSSHAGELTIDEIIQNVERNERLYENIDVKLWKIYRDDSHAADADDPSFKPIDHSRESVRFISQRGKFHIESQTSSDSKRDNWKRSTTRLFDGVTTRVLEVAALDRPGNLVEIKGRKDDPDTVRAHMLLLRIMHYGFPLSTYMRGSQAVRDYPCDVKPEIATRAESRGAAEIDGHRCQVVWITESTGQPETPYDRWVLWLAEDRNYIPIRMEAFTFRWSKDLPIGEAQITQWKEVDSGVWFPLGASHTRYDDIEIQKRNKVPTWRETYILDVVSLDPKYDASFFHELQIPPGTTVREAPARK